MLDIQENANFDNSKRRIDKFCEEFKITRLLTLANAEKEQGVRACLVSLQTCAIPFVLSPFQGAIWG